MENIWVKLLFARSCLVLPLTVPLVWLVAKSNHFGDFWLGHSTISAQCRLHLVGKSEWFSDSTISVSFWYGVTNMFGFLRPSYLVFCSRFLLLLFPFAIFSWWMVCVHPIKFPFHLVLGMPPPIFYILINIVLGIIDAPWLKDVKALNITFIGVPHYYFFLVCGCCFSLLVWMLNGKRFYISLT